MTAKVATPVALATLALLVGCGGGEETTRPTIIVDTVADIDSRDGVLSLREAMMLATGELAVADLDSAEAAKVSGSAGAEFADVIEFDPVVFSVAEPATISLTSALPTLSTGSDTLDGSGAGVIIDGDRGGFECLLVESAGNAIKGLQIENCLTGIGIGVGADNNTIGGPAAGERNVISSNAVGIRIVGSGNVVVGNYMGTDASGIEARPNDMEGIWIASGGQNNVIGGSSPAERNIISGNDLYGLSIDGAGASGNVVKGNYIGVDATGQVALQNRYGVVISGEAADNLVGGNEAGDANVISGNQSAGVVIRSLGTNGNVLMGNYIGTDRTGSQLIPNGYGVWVLKGAQRSIIGGTAQGEGNVIAASKMWGVRIDGADTTGNTVRGNSIYASNRAGISNVEGGNRELIPPTITGVSPVVGTACPDCTVDIYSDSEDEGQAYEGFTVAAADGSFTFEGTLAGPYITATATDLDGNTSQFSAPLPPLSE